jgi:hypothetical protein
MKHFILSLFLFSIACSPIVTLHLFPENKNNFIFRKANIFGLFDSKKELMHKVSEDGIIIAPERELYINQYKKQ